MPITLNAPNFMGPAELARVRDGTLGLENSSTALLGGMQVGNETEKNTVTREAIQQQGQLGLLSNSLDEQKLQQQGQMNQATVADQQQKNATAQQATNQMGQFQQGQLAATQQSNAQQAQQQQQQNAIAQGTLTNQQQATTQQGAYQQGELQNTQQKQAQDTQNQQFQQMMGMKKEDLMQRGAFASYGLLALQNAPTADAANQVAQTFSQQAVTKGYMTQDEATQFNQLPRFQQMSLVSGDVAAGGTAVQSKDLAQANAAANKSGTITLPDGSQASRLTPPEISATQKEIIGAQTSLEQLNKLNQNVQSNWFGAGATFGPEVTGKQLTMSNAPVIGNAFTPSKEDTDNYQNYTNYQANANISILNAAKTLVGGRPNMTDLKLIQNSMPTVGPNSTQAEFNGRMQQVTSALQSAIQIKQQLLQHGLKMSPDDASSLLAKALQGGGQQQPTSSGQQPASPEQQPSSPAQQPTPANPKDPLPGESRSDYLTRMGHSQDNINAVMGGQQ
jgi:hypothetical protein